jgi:hypothetical protein
MLFKNGDIKRWRICTQCGPNNLSALTPPSFFSFFLFSFFFFSSPLLSHFFSFVKRRRFFIHQELCLKLCENLVEVVADKPVLFELVEWGAQNEKRYQEECQRQGESC